MGTSVITAYIWALVVCLVLLLVAVVISSMIPNKPGNADKSQRRTVYWVCFVITVALAFGINFFLASKINIPSKHGAYITATAISTGCAAVLYILIGFVLSKAMKLSKIGSWF